jgi:hypothetical protein
MCWCLGGVSVCVVRCAVCGDRAFRAHYCSTLVSKGTRLAVATEKDRWVRTFRLAHNASTDTLSAELVGIAARFKLPLLCVSMNEVRASSLLVCAGQPDFIV